MSIQFFLYIDVAVVLVYKNNKNNKKYDPHDVEYKIKDAHDVGYKKYDPHVVVCKKI